MAFTPPPELLEQLTPLRTGLREWSAALTTAKEQGEPPERIDHLRTACKVLRASIAPLQEELDRREAEELLCRDGDGRLGVTTAMLTASLVVAGRAVTMNGAPLSTDERSLVPALVEIDGEFLPFSSHSAWVVDVRTGSHPEDVRAGVHPERRRRVRIVRPRINSYELPVMLRFDERRIHPDTVRELTSFAARFVGLGAMRPAGVFGPRFKNFGRSRIARWDVQEHGGNA